MPTHRPPTQKQEKSSNLLAFGDMLNKPLPYAAEDLIAEPTQKRLQQSSVKYVPFLTGDNSLLDQLSSALNNSPTLGAIVQQKTAYTLAGGFYAVPKSSQTILPIASQKSEVNIKEAMALNEFLQSVNMQAEDIEELSLKAVRSLWSFGNVFFELLRYGQEGEKQFEIRELPIYHCRPMKAPEDELWPTHIGVSEEFEEDNLTPSEDNVTNYPLYPEWEEIDGIERCIVHIKNEHPNFYYWGAPDWLPARIWAEMEYRGAKYNQNKFENGFMPSAILTIKGDMTKKEAKDLIFDVRDSFTQTGNNAKIFAHVQSDPAAGVDVDVLSNAEEGEFIALNQQSREGLIIGSRWTPSLAGLSTAGQLGSNQQIRAEFDIVHQTTIRPIQKKYLKALNKILTAAGEWLGGWSSINLEIRKASPISFASDINPNDVLSEDQKLEALGFEPKKD